MACCSLQGPSVKSHHTPSPALPQHHLHPLCRGQAAASSAEDALGSTIVGTYGYMAPEQFRGAASPASDLYGLGGTLLFLLSGRPPSAFPVERMRIDCSSGGWMGGGWATVGGSGRAGGAGGVHGGVGCLAIGSLLMPTPAGCPVHAVKMGARLEAVVDGLLEPLPEDRLPAEDALAILTGQPRPARWVGGQ